MKGGKVEWGIFAVAPYLQRSLLWYQPTPSGRIDFSQSSIQQPPTWSWMAYEGSIDYLNVGKCPEWDKAVQLSEDSARLKVRAFKLPEVMRFMRFPETDNNGEIAYAQEDKKVGHIWFDQSTPETPAQLRCALIGRDPDRQEGERKYYVLLLPAEDMSPLERLGVGWVCESVIDFGNQDTREIA